MTCVNSIDSEVSNTVISRRDKKNHNRNNENLGLDHLLRPLWLVSYAFGVLPVTYQPRRKHSRIKLFVSYTAVFVTLALLSCAFVFTLVQLFAALKQENSDIHAIIPVMIWLCPGFIALFTQIYYVVRQQSVLEFLKEWRQLEQDLQTKSCITRGLHNKVYFALCFMTVASAGFVSYQVYSQPREPYFISSYDVVLQSLTIGPIVAFHCFMTLLIWISVTLSDCLPEFVFFSASLGIDSLLRDIQTSVSCNKSPQTPLEKRSIHDVEALTPELKRYSISFFATSKTESNVHGVRRSVKSVENAWRKFKGISEIVHKANYLFGTPLLVNHGVYIFLTCTLAYSVLYYFQAAFKNEAISSMVAGYSANLLVIGVRFSFGSWIACHLAKSIRKFTSSLNFFIGENWSCLEKEERDYCLSFLDAVKSSHLAASPCGLYSITPSFFFTILGIVLSYVVVLLQSK